MFSDESVGVSVHAGFPNPGDDRRFDSLNLNQLLISHPTSTFLFRIEGDDWETMGIFNGDIVLVDRALDPHQNDPVIWWQDSEFAISIFKTLTHEATVWGVVTAVIHEFQKRR